MPQPSTLSMAPDQNQTTTGRSHIIRSGGLLLPGRGLPAQTHNTDPPEATANSNGLSAIGGALPFRDSPPRHATRRPQASSTPRPAQGTDLQNVSDQTGQPSSSSSFPPSTQRPPGNHPFSAANPSLGANLSPGSELESIFGLGMNLVPYQVPTRLRPDHETRSRARQTDTDMTEIMRRYQPRAGNHMRSFFTRERHLEDRTLIEMLKFASEAALGLQDLTMPLDYDQQLAYHREIYAAWRDCRDATNFHPGRGIKTQPISYRRLAPVVIDEETEDIVHKRSWRLLYELLRNHLLYAHGYLANKSEWNRLPSKPNRKNSTSDEKRKSQSKTAPPQYENFRSRLDSALHAMRIEKDICKNMMDEDHLMKFAVDPAGIERRTNSNRRGNARKQQIYDAGYAENPNLMIGKRKRSCDDPQTPDPKDVAESSEPQPKKPWKTRQPSKKDQSHPRKKTQSQQELPQGRVEGPEPLLEDDFDPYISESTVLPLVPGDGHYQTWPEQSPFVTFTSSGFIIAISDDYQVSIPYVDFDLWWDLAHATDSFKRFELPGWPHWTVDSANMEPVRNENVFGQPTARELREVSRITRNLSHMTIYCREDLVAALIAFRESLNIDPQLPAGKIPTNAGLDQGGLDIPIDPALQNQNDLYGLEAGYQPPAQLQLTDNLPELPQLPDFMEDNYDDVTAFIDSLSK